MPEVMRPDGTWETITREQYIGRYGEDDWHDLTRPSVALEDMPPEERHFYEKMQDQADTNNALAKAGLTLDDLAVEGDDEEVDFDLGPPVGDAHESVLAQLEYAYERYDKLRNDDMMAVDNAVAGFDRNGRKSPWHEDQQRWLDSVIAYLKADEKA